MSDYSSFEGRVEPIEWGRATYTVLILPEENAESLLADGASSQMAAGVMPFCDALTPGKQRGLLHGIATAKKPETRARRIAAMAESLR